MKKIAITICFLVITAGLLAQFPIAVPGPAGIWILCGNQRAAGFSYQVLRREKGNDEVEIATLSAPAGVAEVQARLMDLMNAGVRVNMPGNAAMEHIFSRFQNGGMDSIAAYRDNYSVLYALGLAIYDQTAIGGIQYAYIVRKQSGNRGESAGITPEVSFPGKPCTAQLLPLDGTALANGIHIEYKVSLQGNMRTARVYRSYYQRSGFEELSITPLFFKKGNDWILGFDDLGASPKVPYSYYVVPLDAAGNAGEPSPQVNMYNVPADAAVPSVKSVSAWSANAEKSIHVNWKLTSTKDVVSVEIFKSLLYDGRYFKVASMNPYDTVFKDSRVEPVVTYYYSLVVNGAYGSSDPSPRISGMLQAVNGNYLPVQGLQAEQNGRVVKLTWNRTEKDTRGYYLHRGIGYQGDLVRIGDIIVSDSAVITAYDTLPEFPSPRVYSYAVTDVNTSYAIGPFSGVVYAYDPGTESVPLVKDISAVEAQGKVMVLWQNVAEFSPFAGSYVLYRRAVNQSGEETEAIHILSTQDISLNSFIDSNLQAGMKYYYSVVCRSQDASITGSRSTEAAISWKTDQLLNVSDIRVFVSGGQVQMQWVFPLGDATQVEILRAEQGRDASVISTLDGGRESYTDTKVSRGKQYFYYFRTRSTDRISAYSEPVGVYVK